MTVGSLKRLNVLLVALAAQWPCTANSGAIPAVRLDTVKVPADGGAVTAKLTDGHRAALTLVSDRQLAASTLLRRARPESGTVIVLDVESGAVEVLAEYRHDDRGLAHPATSFVPAASLFKLVTTTALFEHSELTPDTSVCFSGGEHRIEREHLEPPPADRARCAPFSSALGHSRNAVYAQMAFQHLMRQDLLDVAERIGFNRALPFAVPLRLGTLELPYNDLMFARAAAGFVGSRLSPMGAAQLTYAIARGGLAQRMLLLDSEERDESPVRVMSATTAWRLTRMMEVTVHSGTSLDAFTNENGLSYLGDVRVAGKTGTLRAAPGAPMTSWFTGFAPSRHPRYVVTVMLQNGKVWHQRANQVARDMLRVLFADKNGVTSPLP